MAYPGGGERPSTTAVPQARSDGKAGSQVRLQESLRPSPAPKGRPGSSDENEPGTPESECSLSISGKLGCLMDIHVVSLK